MAGKGDLWVGTSGWSYDHWDGTFYPEDVSSKERLKYYATKFDTAEINNSFYQLPKEDTLEQWKKTAGSGFVFAVKGSRYITHMKKLKDPEDSLQKFLKPVDSLKTKQGPVLFQLPGGWRANSDRLSDFLKMLPTGHRWAFEFRDPDWHCDEMYELLHKRNAAFCMFEFAGLESPREITASFVYIRLHGPNKEPYTGSYTDKALKDWASDIRKWLKNGKDVYCYFDNDQAGHAPNDALRLKEMI
ncbi:MAG: DUF72 domain-containing protein [Desulfofustis sp.]